MGLHISYLGAMVEMSMTLTEPFFKKKNHQRDIPRENWQIFHCSEVPIYNQKFDLGLCINNHFGGL